MGAPYLLPLLQVLEDVLGVVAILGEELVLSMQYGLTNEPYDESRRTEDNLPNQL